MFNELEKLTARPAPFSAMTTAILWADPHTSQHMLRYHLDGTVNISSRTTEFVNRSIDWLTGVIGVGAGTRVLDLGCGPGLYSNRLAALGADVTGVDFSARSISYARDTAPTRPLRANYIQGDYLDVPIPGTFDVALMIMCDFCALSPEQRGRVLRRLRTLLDDGGRFIFDVYGLAALAVRQEKTSYTENPTGGFWSPNPNFEFLHSFIYESERVSLDKYDIFEAHRSRTIYNWLQFYDARTLETELRGHGYEIAALTADLTGTPFDPDGPEFAVISTPRAEPDRTQ